MYGLGSDFVNWLSLVLSGVVSSGAVVGLIYYAGKETYKDILNRKLETFKSDLNHDMENFKYDLSKSLEKHKQELGIEATRTQLTLQSQIQFKERQLSEFYGPVYSLLKRIRPIDNLWNAGRLKEIDTVARHVIRESNDKIVEIILTKGHLIQGEVIPTSYTGFLSHVAVWHAFLDLPSDKWEVYHKLQEAQYQQHFEEEVFLTTETLKRELYSLYEQYGLSPIKIGATDLNRERGLRVQSEAPAVVQKS
jgi:hypothetical protein